MGHRVQEPLPPERAAHGHPSEHPEVKTSANSNPVWSKFPLEMLESLGEQGVRWESLGLSRLRQWMSYMCEGHPRAHMTRGTDMVIRIN